MKLPAADFCAAPWSTPRNGLTKVIRAADIKAQQSLFIDDGLQEHSS